MDFGSGNSRRIISINESYDKLGDVNCLALPFFHSFSGCDSTSSFYKKSKTVLFDYWMDSAFKNEITTAFQQLSWLPSPEIVRDNYAVVERFMVSVYKKRKEDQDMSLNDLRFTLYNGAANDNLRELPPTRNALQQHTKECLPSWLGLGQYFVSNKHRLTRCSPVGVEPE